MIYTDRLPHTFDYFAEDFYKQQNVTADNFDSFKTSLYSNAGVKILEGMQKIKFNYYSPSDQLLASDTVLVVKEGEHLPDNLGVESVTPSDALKDDYFIYTGEDTDNYKYGDLIQFDGTNWEKVPDSSEKVAQSLSTALSSDALDWSRVLDNEGVLSKMISKLAVNEAFITKLASTMITLHQDNGKGGLLKSANYNGLIDSNGRIEEYGELGWCIDYNGKADFSDGNFSGTLDCGQLKVQKEIYSTIDTITKSSKTFYEIVADYGRKNELDLSSFVDINLIFNDRPSGTFTVDETIATQLKLGTGHEHFHKKIDISSYVDYDEYYYYVYWNNDSNFSTYTIRTGFGDPIKIDEYVLFVYEGLYNGLAFKLIDLPTAKPTAKGIVWNNNGALNIT